MVEVDEAEEGRATKEAKEEETGIREDMAQAGGRAAAGLVVAWEAGSVETVSEGAVVVGEMALLEAVAAAVGEGSEGEATVAEDRGGEVVGRVRAAAVEKVAGWAEATARAD
mmetsp:Transcript_32126/g.61829  ORF Transcript_32126/g.61829 Transcript_32126/m.61829 type:complete len:112 (-) Transcript_32126:1203-1538(-)